MYTMKFFLSRNLTQVELSQSATTAIKRYNVRMQKQQSSKIHNYTRETNFTSRQKVNLEHEVIII